MTRKEKRTRLIEHMKYSRSIGADYSITDEDADEIIKALEQEPCDDVVSRQAVLGLHQLRLGAREIYKAIYDLPPVIPQLYEVYVVTYWSDDITEPIVTVFNNKENADMAYNYFIKSYNCCVDRCPIYENFIESDDYYRGAQEEC